MVVEFPRRPVRSQSGHELSTRWFGLGRGPETAGPKDQPEEPESSASKSAESRQIEIASGHDLPTGEENWPMYCPASPLIIPL